MKASSAHWRNTSEAMFVNGMENFWSLLNRGYHGAFHHFSAKHAHRYVGKFAGRHNFHDLNTIDQMQILAKGMVGKRLQYKDLSAST